MNNIQEEQYEYEKFMLALAHKLQEINQDFAKLSIENKYKVEGELKNALDIGGLAGVLKHINMYK